MARSKKKSSKKKVSKTKSKTNKKTCCDNCKMGKKCCGPMKAGGRKRSKKMNMEEIEKFIIKEWRK